MRFVGLLLLVPLLAMASTPGRGLQHARHWCAEELLDRDVPWIHISGNGADASFPSAIALERSFLEPPIAGLPATVTEALAKLDTLAKTAQSDPQAALDVFLDGAARSRLGMRLRPGAAKRLLLGDGDGGLLDTAGENPAHIARAMWTAIRNYNARSPRPCFSFDFWHRGCEVPQAFARWDPLEGLLRPLRSEDPLERVLLQQIVAYMMEEFFHQLQYEARGFAVTAQGEVVATLLMPETRAFARWLDVHRNEVLRFMPTLRRRCRYGVDIRRFWGDLIEVDVHVFRRQIGLEMLETDESGRYLNYPIRALYDAWVRGELE